MWHEVLAAHGDGRRKACEAREDVAGEEIWIKSSDMKVLTMGGRGEIKLYKTSNCRYVDDRAAGLIFLFVCICVYDGDSHCEGIFRSHCCIQKQMHYWQLDQ